MEPDITMPDPAGSTAPGSASPDPQLVWEALKSVNDPELGVNIVDLGLVYDVKVQGANVDVTMTMTTPACPLSSYFERAVPLAVRSRVKDAGLVLVHLVWEPRWRPDRMTEAAKRALGWMR